MEYNLFGYKWQEWYHTKWDGPAYDSSYFGSDGIEPVDGGMRLFVKKEPRHWSMAEYAPVDSDHPDAVLKRYCCGELMSADAFTYGTFDFEVTAPSSPRLWPALWLCGAEQWPPEIDVFEGYSGDGTYRDGLLFSAYTTDVHYKDGERHMHIGQTRLLRPLKALLSNGTDRFRLVWRPDVIRFYWNGILIRSVRDKKVLESINRTPRMNVIMNIMTDEGFSEEDYRKASYDGLYLWGFSYKPLE